MNGVIANCICCLLATSQEVWEGHSQAFPFQLPVSDIRQSDLKGIPGSHGTAALPFPPPWYSGGDEPRQESSEHHSFSPTQHPFSHLLPPLPFSLQLFTHLPLKEFVEPVPQLTKRVLEASVV